MSKRLAVAASSAAFALAALSPFGALAQSSKNGATTDAAGNNVPAPTVMLVPIEVSNKAIESGCWVQLFDERNFKGDMLTVAGPAELEAMDDKAGRALKRRIDSLTTGPKTKLTVYEHRMFKDRAVEFGPNSKEPGLVKKLGFTGRLQSMKVDCAG